MIMGMSLKREIICGARIVLKILAFFAFLLK